LAAKKKKGKRKKKKKRKKGKGIKKKYISLLKDGKGLG